jgi:hypothetical protein
MWEQSVREQPAVDSATSTILGHVTLLATWSDS